MPKNPKEYYQKNKEKLQKYNRDYYYNHKLKIPGYRARANLRQNELKKAHADENKRRIVQLMGGRCLHCGYHKNLAALELHHPDGRQENEGDLYSVLIGPLTDEEIAEICKGKELLCSNCHKETHFPDKALS
jgi:hypothetical protein